MIMSQMGRQTLPTPTDQMPKVGPVKDLGYARITPPHAIGNYPGGSLGYTKR